VRFYRYSLKDRDGKTFSNHTKKYAAEKALEKAERRAVKRLGPTGYTTLFVSINTPQAERGE